MRDLTPIQKAQLKRKEMAEAGERRLNPLEKAAKNPRSRSLAIRAKCYDCVGQDCDPGWRARITDCNAPTCPLWPLRPYQKGDDDEEEG